VERESILVIGYLAGLRICFHDKFQGGRRIRDRKMDRKVTIDIYLFQCLWLCLTEILNNLDRSSLDNGNVKRKTAT
jgi:hypothetical protein